jgi:hypothetical protein
MTRRTIESRLEIATARRLRRGKAFHSDAPQIEGTSEFTEEEKKTLDSAAVDAMARVKERFQPRA